MCINDMVINDVFALDNKNTCNQNMNLTVICDSYLYDTVFIMCSTKAYSIDCKHSVIYVIFKSAYVIM